jgi:hypothetical protein
MTTHVDDTDRLITRLVDDEAGADEQKQFEDMASVEPELWRTLATRFQDTIRLARAFDDEIGDAAETELPESTPAPLMTVTNRTGWTFAAVGWAAVMVLGVMWAAVYKASPGGAGVERMDGSHSTIALTADEHLDEYRRAPFCLDELEPVVLQIEEMSDGRFAVRYVRRFEEVAFFEPDEELPIDELGVIVVEPKTLRDTVPPRTPTAD